MAVSVEIPRLGVNIKIYTKLRKQGCGRSCKRGISKLHSQQNVLVIFFFFNKTREEICTRASRQHVVLDAGCQAAVGEESVEDRK